MREAGGLERMAGEKVAKVMGGQGVGSSLGQTRGPPPIGLGEPNVATSKAALEEGGLEEAGLVVWKQLHNPGER